MSEPTPIEDLVVAEKPIPEPIPVRRSEAALREPSLITVDPQELAVALEETDYLPLSRVPLLVDYNQKDRMLGRYSLINNEASINEHSILRLLQDIRKSIHNDLDNRGKTMKDMMKDALWYYNPRSWPYIALRNRGRKIFSGNKQRRWRHYRQAREGFTIKRGNETVTLSKEESIARTKAFMDHLLEQAAPGFVGGILAHEYRHPENSTSPKQKIVETAPIFAGLAKVAEEGWSLTDPRAASVLAGAMTASLLGEFIVRRAEEKDSHIAEERHASVFKKAVSINHEVFQQKVLGIPPTSTEPTTPLVA